MPSSEVVDELNLDLVAGADVVAVAGLGLEHDAVLRAVRAEREAVRVAVHGEERVARAVAGGVRVRLVRGRIGRRGGGGGR